jgi:hypothetical protein
VGKTAKLKNVITNVMTNVITKRKCNYKCNDKCNYKIEKMAKKSTKIAVFGLNLSAPRNLYFYITTRVNYLLV